MKALIKRIDHVPAHELIHNPENFRSRSEEALSLFDSLVEEIGFVGAFLGYETEDGIELINGHGRAPRLGKHSVPVAILDVNDRTAKQIIAIHDRLSANAEVHEENIVSLIDDLRPMMPNLNDFFDDIRAAFAKETQGIIEHMGDTSAKKTRTEHARFRSWELPVNDGEALAATMKDYIKKHGSLVGYGDKLIACIENNKTGILG